MTGVHLWEPTTWLSPVSSLFIWLQGIYRTNNVAYFNNNLLKGSRSIKNNANTASGNTAVFIEPPACNDALVDNCSRGKWIHWPGRGVKALYIYLAELVYYNTHTESSSPTDPTLDISSPTDPTLDISMPKNETQEQRTAEKAYRFNDNGRVLKRSLKPHEYRILSNGKPFVPTLVVERLKNEAACMELIGEHTDIPVPRLLETFEEDGSYHLWMEFVNGVELRELTAEEQSKVFPEVQSIIATLRRLRSSRSGGPTGLLCPPSIVSFYHLSEWEQRISAEEQFVFCHGDLSQANILVDQETLKISAILDWEYSGFYPPEHEIPFYESSESSGSQVISTKLKPVVDRIVKFWRQSQKPIS